jgi:hypothetical protein
MGSEVDNDDTVYYLKCLLCSDTNEKAGLIAGNADDDAEDTGLMACRLCDRYYTKGRLFLNNVG